MQLKPHSRLQNGKYEIIHELGQGGFGITYLAEQVLMDRLVCIKEFYIKEYCKRNSSSSRVSLGTPSNAAMVEQYMAKFIKEAKTIAKLDHPNIVRIYDVFKENDTAYIVMEFIEGLSFSEYIKRNGPMSEEKAITYIQKVGKALSFAHSMHIMHLDIKPSNIMLDVEHDRPVLIDFGMAKQYTEGGEQTSSTPVGISQGYAPLEQYRAGGIKEFSPATDVYSLGATLYKLLTGNTPPSASEVNEDGMPTILDNVSPYVCKVIEVAMHPLRKCRFQSVDSFMKMLEDSDIDVEIAGCSEETHNFETNVLNPSPQIQNKVSIFDKILEKRSAKYGVAGVATLLALFLFYFLFGNGNFSRDSLLIDGKQAYSIELNGSYMEKDFKIDKNFEERWTYSGVPEWCFAKAVEGKISLSVLENKTGEDRTAIIVFRKKNVNKVLAKLTINQNAQNTSGTVSVGAVGSIKFTSRPSGASIWIDGKNTQMKTPAIIKGIPVGKHLYKLVLEGHNSYSGIINVTSNTDQMNLERLLTVSSHKKTP